MVVSSKSRGARSVVLLAGLVGAVVVAMNVWSPRVSESSAEPALVDLQAPPPVAQTAASSDYALASTPEYMFFSSPTLSRSWSVRKDRRSVRITTYEKDSAGEVFTLVQDISTSFEIQDIAPRGGDELFVAGYPVRGGFVIEHWALPEVPGALSATLTPPGAQPSGGQPPLLGVPTPPWGGQVYVPGGGSQTPLSQRSQLPPVERTTFAEDMNVRHQGIGADPEGRFVLVVTDDGELRQYFPSTSLDDYAVLETSTSLLGLEHIEGLFFRVQHAVFGRVWFLEWFNAKDAGGTPIHPDLYQTVILEDTDNDGVFDFVNLFLEDGPQVDPYLDATQWLDTFVSAP
jgi:hypothetical protein